MIEALLYIDTLALVVIIAFNIFCYLAMLRFAAKIFGLVSDLESQTHKSAEHGFEKNVSTGFEPEDLRVPGCYYPSNEAIANAVLKKKEEFTTRSPFEGMDEARYLASEKLFNEVWHGNP